VRLHGNLEETYNRYRLFLLKAWNAAQSEFFLIQLAENTLFLGEAYLEREADEPIERERKATARPV